jgi:hypothetical protein
LTTCIRRRRISTQAPNPQARWHINRKVNKAIIHHITKENTFLNNSMPPLHLMASEALAFVSSQERWQERLQAMPTIDTSDHNARRRSDAEMAALARSSAMC